MDGVAVFLCRRELGRAPATGAGPLLSRVPLSRAAAPDGRRDLFGHYGCVNAVEFSPCGGLLASGGDDRRALVWNLERALDRPGSSGGRPRPFREMSSRHDSNIFCLDFSRDGRLLFSGGNDEQVLVHDLSSGRVTDVFRHDQPVYGLSSSPHDPALLATACSDGEVQVFDLRLPPSESEPLLLATHGAPFHAVAFNPAEPRLLSAANHKMGAALWDLRRPRRVVLEYGNVNGRPDSAMSVSFNSSGTRLLVLRRRLPPVLYDLHSPVVRCEFDHPGYYNSCTMKSCCFAGQDDDFVMTGSDDFNLYMWKIPEQGESVWVDTAHSVLRGHRSIVNQVRYNKHYGFAASAGVEKIVKIWSTLPLPGEPLAEKQEDLKDQLLGRKIYTREEYRRAVMSDSSLNPLAREDSPESTAENVRMMAFFDDLVQREMHGSSSSSSDDDMLGNSPRPSSPHDEDLDCQGVRRISHVIARRRHQLGCGARRRSFTKQSHIRWAMKRARAVARLSSPEIEEDEQARASPCTSSSSSSSSSEGEDASDFIGPRVPPEGLHSLPVDVSTNGPIESVDLNLNGRLEGMMPEALRTTPPIELEADMREEIRLSLNRISAIDTASEDANGGQGETEGTDPVPSTSRGPVPLNSSDDVESREKPLFKKSSKAKRTKRNYRTQSGELGSD